MKNNFQNILNTIDQSLAELNKKQSDAKRAGIIRSSKDGVLEIGGIQELRMGEMVRVEETGTRALVVQVGKDATYAVVLEPSKEVRTGLSVISEGKFLSISVSDAILGRVVDPLGTPLDGKPSIVNGTLMPLEAPAPDVIGRQSVNQPVQTGIVAIDALIPIGRGQRELIIGDRQTGKTTIAIDTILNQKDQDMICVYVAIAQRDSKTAQVLKTLTEHGAMKYTVVVSVSAAQPAMLQFLTPYAGAAIAEYFMKKGKDTLVIYDDLSKHAVAYREVSLLLRKPPGREAYPGDVFYIHSRLLERAARLNKENGGGSMTALPIIETQAGDVSAYIPTNVISITDGQIFLEPGLFNRGVRPAINVGISVSRVGSAAQTKIIKKISGRTKLDLAQYYELAAFAQFASELDASSKKQLARGQALVEAMKQKHNSPRKLWEESVILWSVTNGYFDAIAPNDIPEKIEFLLHQIAATHTKLVNMIEEKKELIDDISKELEKVVPTIVK